MIRRLHDVLGGAEKDGAATPSRRTGGATRTARLESATIALAVSIAAAVLLAGGCGDGTGTATGKTIDAVNYFPLEMGRYWVYFNADGEFLTLSFSRSDTVVGFDVLVLTYTFARSPGEAEEVSPSYEAYYGLDADQGILLYGYKDYDFGESATFSPGILFAGNDMVLEEPVTTATAESGRLVTYVTTLVAQGIVETYFGTFQDAVDITIGPEEGEQPKHFLARDFGMVKFDWKGVRYQLYDYGRADGGSEE